MYDVVIIGGGPAGLTAGLYAARGKLKTLIIEKEMVGGQIKNTSEIANYPGAIEGDSGSSLTMRMLEQAKSFGAIKVNDDIIEMDLEGKVKKIKGKNDEYEAKSVILATGANPRLMNVPGEEEFAGKGVSYCVTCDGPFFQDLETFVIGGGDSAVEEAGQLSKFAKKVTIVHRRDELRAAKSIQEDAFNNEKIEFMWDTVVKEIKGEGLLKTIVFENVKTGEETVVNASEEDGMMGIFVYVGFIPSTEIFKDHIELENGYIKANENMETNIDGVFAAGDNRIKPLRQLVTATSDGAVAAINAEKYINRIWK